MAKLILVRHGQSEWNVLDLWTGWTDVSLTEKGKEEARTTANAVKDIHLDEVFISKLKRAIQTWDEMNIILKYQDIPIHLHEALNERDYGNFDGRHKSDIEQEYGKELFDKWHRSWDYPVPHGETLKQVYERVIPYFESTILPLLKQDKNVIIVAHGNSLRALIKYLEHVSEEEIPHVEIATGGAIIYEINTDGKVMSKEIIGSLPNKV